MASKIQVKRGNKADLPILSDGEFGLCQDTGEIYIGNGSANLKIFPTTSIAAGNVTVTDAGGMFESTTAEGALAELATTILEILSGVIAVGKADDADTVGGFTVAKNVPSNAVFTDTVTTVNGKTGAIAKADIVALGIPAQDTVYSHPATHAISEVSGLQGALDEKVDDSQVLTNVPAGAVFTDTVTTINGKTGAITKADIVALGIPAEDTNTTYSNATTSAAGLMSAADKTKLDGIETGANNYVHPTTAGNKHIPSGGAANQYLKYSASGTAVWSALGDASSVDGKSVWVGAVGSKGTDANTLYFCY